MMVPDSKARYETAILELENLLEEAKDDEAVEAELKTEASEIIAAYKSA